MFRLKFLTLILSCFLFSGTGYSAPEGDQIIIDQPRLRQPTYMMKVTRDEESLTKILCLDGGGVRGAYTAQILRIIESQLHEDKRLCDVFQGGITGTSTGSFIALGLSAPKHRDENGEWQQGPYSPTEIVELYQEMGEQVFKCWSPSNCWNNASSGFNQGLCAGLKKAAWNLSTCFGCMACSRNCNGFCGPQYSNSRLREALEYKFGDMKLEESLVPVQVVAYDIGQMKPMYFNSYDTPKTSFVDAALCSSAAPTYFTGVSIPRGDGSRAYCIDGGIFDNSAAIAALRFGSKHYHSLHPVQDSPHLDDFILLSIGTGEEILDSQYKRLKHAGKLGWASAAVGMSINGTTQSTHSNLSEIYQLRHKAGEARKYFRVQTQLTSQTSKMDDPQIIDSLLATASTQAGKASGVCQEFIQLHITQRAQEAENALEGALINLFSQESRSQESHSFVIGEV